MNVKDLASLACKIDPKTRVDWVLLNRGTAVTDFQFHIQTYPPNDYIMEYHANGPPTYRAVEPPITRW